MKKTPSFYEIKADLDTTALRIQNMLFRCGNEVMPLENDEDICEVLYTIMAKSESEKKPFETRMNEVISKYLADENYDPDKEAYVPINDYIAPLSIDTKTSPKYIKIDDVYYSFGYIPSKSYGESAVAGWLSMLINLGEGIDVDFFVHKENIAIVTQKLQYALRYNKVKARGMEDTSTDFDDISSAIRSGYYLKAGIASGEDFCYMSTLLTITAHSIDELEWKTNEIKTYFNEAFTKKNDEINNKIINEKLEGEKIDVTLPGVCIKCGAPNILEKTIEEVEELFMSLGFDVVDGPEIEEDKYNFELLNIPKGHPARDAQDTFYIVNDEVLLRSQTSPVQARTMLKGNGETPIRMICPGKTYRRDDDDATHSHQFMQIEGLVVDKEISLSDLKGIFDLLAKKLFGENCVTRFRPSYYQFTEPSVETDISCFACNGKGCSLCKNTGWITVAGAGIVHPNVLKNCGYDPNKWTGFAFGFGAERLAMLKYNINDIRTFYTADLREVQVFDRKEN